MVGPLTVLKMLHCKKMCSESKIRTAPINDVKPDETSCDVKSEYIKTETDNELCRICLKHGTIPIFRDDRSEDLSDAVIAFGGIELSMFDAHPKYLCQSCHVLLQAAILFKKTAQESDKRLKKSSKPEPEIEDHYSDSAHDNAEESSSSLVDQKSGIWCKQCNIHFNTFQEYDNHRLTDDHENQRKTCEICKKSYSISYFKKHMEIHNKVTSYICDVCGKHFILQCQFQRHRLTHFYSLPYKCSLCPYKGRFTESLKMHMRSHTGERPYICEECPQRFVSKSNLNKHMLTHKKERDFTCECGRGYYTKREFDMHFKVEHVGVKEHVCPICGKAFGYRKQMMKHQLKVHKREKLKSGRMPIYLKVEKMQQEENNTASS